VLGLSGALPGRILADPQPVVSRFALNTGSIRRRAFGRTWLGAASGQFLPSGSAHAL